MTTRPITRAIPDKALLAEQADAASFARERRLLAAVRRYELGRLASGRAAALAGRPRVELLLALGRYQVFPFQAELNDLEAPGSEGTLPSTKNRGRDALPPRA